MAIGLVATSPRSLTEQSVILLTLYPQFSIERTVRAYTWTGELQPTPLADRYRMRITYMLGDLPRVDVLGPPLRPRGSEAIPHLYAGGNLCLFTPGGWTSAEWIATTIVPWSVTWLSFYETWHVTGRWLGGGEHPVGTSGLPRRRRR